MSLLQNEVYLEPISHTYTGISDGRKYTSVSHVLNTLEEKTDWDSIAGKVAGKGKFAAYDTKEKVLAFWKANAKEAMDHGTHLHEAQERYSNEFAILPEDMKYEKGIKHIASLFSDFYMSKNECCVYSKKYGVAGTMDKCSFVKKGSNLISISDFKTGLKTDKIDYFNKDGKFLLHPVSHLQNCKYIRYAIQVSIYAVLAEECAGLKLRDANIIFIPVDYNVMPYVIPVPFLKNEAIAILENFRIKNEVVKKTLDEDAPTFIDSL